MSQNWLEFIHEKYPETKDKKACSVAILLDRSSSLVWMTHSHCVRDDSPQRSWVQIPSGPLN